MADDPTQRPYRSNETLARATPARPQSSPQGGSSGSDPLAELARLIGQNDPFAEFGANGQRRVAAPNGNGYDAPAIAPAAQAFNQQEAPYQPAYNPPPISGRPNFGGAPLTGADLYHTDQHPVPGYAPAHQADQHPHDAGYDDQHYTQGTPPQVAPEEEDYYEDETSGRKRMGVMVIAGIFALAVIGTAGAFGYRALFGSSTSSGPPPVIKADSAPSKVVPASNKDTSNKQITDRINDRGMGEKIVSREEQPVDVKDRIFPQDTLQPQAGSGVVGSDAKRVRTIAIRPDQGPPDAQPAPQAAPPPQPAARAATNPPARPAGPAPSPRVISTAQQAPPAADTDPEPAPAPRQAVARAAPPAQPAASANAPLSLSPDAAPVRPAAAPRAAAPARIASTPPAQQPAPQPAQAQASANGGAAYVQVSSQRSEAEAQAAFQSLQGKFPGQLGGKQAVIRKVDLGDKGTYYRAMVPAGSSAQAAEICTAMKAAGGSCLVQRN